jgi:predicted transcriptional regulator
MIKVKDFMSASLVVLSPSTAILEAARQLVESRISGAPVVDQTGNLVGVLSEKDCMRIALQAGYHSEAAGTVAEYMHKEVKTVDAERNIVDVAMMFIEDDYRRYPVMKDGRLVGQISRRDVLKALAALS